MGTNNGTDPTTNTEKTILPKFERDRVRQKRQQEQVLQLGQDREDIENSSESMQYKGIRR